MKLAAVVYTLAAVVYTWPLAIRPATHLAAPIGPGDPFLNLWILGWGMQTILSDPAALVTGRIFNANIFYPAESTLAYSDHLLLQSVVLTPLYALTGDPVVCYNLLLFASLVASAIAMHLFVRAVVGSEPAAYLAGVAWAFWPYRFAHLLHLQLQALYFLPLAFLLVHRVVAGRRHRDALALGAVAGLQAISSVYYAVIGGVGLCAAAVTLAIGVGRWRSRVIGSRFLLAAVVAAVVIAPVVVVYVRVRETEGFGRGLYEASRNAASVSSYVQTPPGNLVYGRTGLLRAGGSERELFPGAVVLLLAVAGVALGRRTDARPLVISMIAVGSLGALLSLGPDGIRSVYAAFQQLVFGFTAIRAPARFGVLVMFAVATLAALGWRELSNGAHGTTGLVKHGLMKGAMYGVVVASAIEYLNVPIPLVPAPSRVTSVGQWLKRAPEPGAVVHLPLGLDTESTSAMVQSLEHRRPLVNGYSGQRPSFYAALADSLSTFPHDEALLALNEAGVRFVVTREPVTRPATDAPWPLSERARFPDGVIYEFRSTPELEERLTAMTAIVPVPPGPLPFADGEASRYRALWTGAAIDLPAGEITIVARTVSDAGGTASHTFVVLAETAPWVARFFEARDQFTTQTDAQLLPQVHERDQWEGSRHVTRAFVYSHAERLVRVGRDTKHALGEGGISLPLLPWSRDAMAALFYARTLPLDPGQRYLIPVNEAGRNLTVELVVTGREDIEVQGQRVRALRLDPRMRRRVERRQPMTATVWVSDDARKVPLAFSVEAGFGHVRAELVSYLSKGAP